MQCLRRRIAPRRHQIHAFLTGSPGRPNSRSDTTGRTPLRYRSAPLRHGQATVFEYAIRSPWMSRCAAQQICQPAVRRGLGLERSNTSAIRVCQPGPEAFQLAITSGGSRSDSRVRGFASLGRPRRTSCSPSYKSAPRFPSTSSCGTSSSLREVRLEPFRFSLMAMPHADDASGCPTWRPRQDHKSGIEPPDGNESVFPKVTAQVRSSVVWPSKNLFCPKHV